jgi:ubiquinone/menaquinone biosynthesis C-methylase UbiE
MIRLILFFFVAVVTDIPWLRKTGWQRFYQRLATIRPNDFALMNYGYAGLANIKLDHSEQNERYNYQLYHHVSGGIDFKQRDVLEVGSGRGGGAFYVHKYLGPRKMVGVDLSDKAVKLSNSRYQSKGLEFVIGNAEKLPMPGESFDVVMNIESAVCYSSRENFFREAHRVLRTGGYFLYADIEKKELVDSIDVILKKTGLTVVRREVINPGVIEACSLDGKRRKKLIDSLWRSPISRIAMYNFAATPKSYMYKKLKSGDIQYFRYVLRK